MKKKLSTRRLTAQAKGPRRSVFPAHLQTTPEKWRTKKQQEWAEVMGAMDRYSYGAAYVPAKSALYQLGQLARQIKEALNRKDWVAW